MYKKILDEDVLKVIKQVGPCQPSNVKKYIEGSDTMMIGAVLSSLLAKGEVFLSNTKRGGSKFYYTEEQIQKLVNIAQYLNEKDLRTYKLLEKEKVLRDKTQTPLVRVSLRNIPDFAKKIEAIVDDHPEIFWRYFLVEEKDTPPIIKNILGITDEEEKEPEKKEQMKIEPVIEVIEEEPKKEEMTEEKQTTLQKETPKDDKEIQRLRKEVEELKRIVAHSGPSIKENEDPFVTETREFCIRKNIEILDYEVIKKKKDIEFKARYTSELGDIIFFGIAKAKKRITEKEIEKAYEKATGLGLPLMCICKAPLSKKLQKTFKERFTNAVALHTE